MSGVLEIEGERVSEGKSLSMVNALERAFHRYSRKFGYVMELVLPFAILGYLLSQGFVLRSGLMVMISDALWGFLVFNTVILFLSTVLSKAAFKLGISHYIERGYPVTTIRGYEKIVSNINKMVRLGFAIFVAILASLVFYIISVYFGLIPLIYVAISLTLIGFGFTLLLKRPKEAVVEPAGGLLELYTPVEFPIYIDNMFQDTIVSVMDPLTYLKYDDWIYCVKKAVIVPEGLDERTALERAIEKIFLMAMLRKEFPKLIPSDEIVIREIEEVINPKNVDDVIEHEHFGLKNLYRILERFKMAIPEVELMVNRLFLVLRDNLKEFKDSDLYIETTVNSEVKGLRNVGLLVFLFNNSDLFKDRPRPVRVYVRAPGFDPEEVSVDVNLDPKGDFRIESDKLEVVSEEGEDVVGVLSQILQIGDAVWFVLKPKDYGLKTISVCVIENGKVVYGRTLLVDVKRNLLDQIKSVVGGGSIGGGILIPLVKLASAFLTTGF